TPPAAAASTENVLERAVLDDPDDLAAHSAYADWLGQEGDPRGELIQVQLALEKSERPAQERKELQRREQALLGGPGGAWLGGLADFLVGQQGVDDYFLKHRGGYQFQWARGWLETIRVPQLSVAFARALARAPQARLLRRLIIEAAPYDDEGGYEA